MEPESKEERVEEKNGSLAINYYIGLVTTGKNKINAFANIHANESKKLKVTNASYL